MSTLKMFKVIMPNGKEYGPYKTEGSAKACASREWKNNKGKWSGPNIGYDAGNPVVIAYEMVEFDRYEWPEESLAVITLRKEKEKLERELAAQRSNLERQIAWHQRQLEQLK